MRTFSTFAIAAITLCLSACDFEAIRGNGQIITDQRTIAEFSEIQTSGALHVEWKSGPAALSIRTDENLLRYIESRNVGKRLELSSRHRLSPTDRIRITISSPNLVAAKLSGASQLIAHGVTGRDFSVQSTGAASVTVDGTVEELFADMTGASDLRAHDLHTRNVEIATTGAADAWVNASETLRVSITGAGDVSYAGNPKTIDRHIMGAGSIRRKD